MRGRVVLAGILGAGLALAPAASAQETTGEFGGGAVTSPPTPALEQGNMVIGLRSLCPTPGQPSGCAGGATVQISATVVGRCASGTFATTVPVAGDGAFSATGAVRQNPTITRYELRGVLSERPSGTLTARFERATKTGTRRCSAIDVVWEARSPAAGAIGIPAAVAPGALLLGTTAQRVTRSPGGLEAPGAFSVPGAIALRASPGGTSVSRAIYGVRMSCTGAGTSPTFDLPRDDLPIAADGSVRDRQEGQVTTDASILTYVERFSATVGSTGAEGSFSVQLSVRLRTTGKRVTLCRSGDVRWSASL